MKNRMVKILKYAILVVALISIGTVIGVRIYRDRVTAPHEVPAGSFQPLVPMQGVRILLDGCIPVESDDSGVRVRAFNLSPQLTFVSTLADAEEFDVHVLNVDRDRVAVSGAEKVKPAADESGLHLRVTVPPGETHTVGLEPEAGGEFTFYFLGDNRHNYTWLKKIFDDANREKPLFVFNGGDLVNEGTQEQIEVHMRETAGLSVPYFTALGNHDLTKPDWRADAYVSLFGPTYHTFAFENCFFVVLDTGKGLISKRQLRWFREVLEEGRKSENLFVIAHYPPFDIRRGKHHCMRPFIGGAGAIVGLMKEFDVDYFLGSHIHSFFQHEKDEITYVVSGGGGASMTTPLPYFHYVAFTVDGDKVTPEVRILDQGD